MDQGEIYLITNMINFKSYVGQTKCFSKNGGKKGYIKRWEDHIRKSKRNKNEGCVALNNAIDKYGPDNFVITLVDTCNLSEIDDYEKYYIKIYGTLCPYGYNIRSGGKDGYFTKESRDKMRKSKLGKNNHNYGKERSEETKKKIGDSKRGEKHHFFGKKLSIQHKLNLSKAHKKDNELPMYMVYIKGRPEHYTYPGYAILNHPSGIKKYFTSKKFTIEEKHNMAFAFLNELNEKYPENL